MLRGRAGGRAGELFALLYATASADQALADAGMIRADSDPLWRALQQLVLIVGPLLLRPLIEQQLGGSLFEPANLERWMRANADLLKHGLYTPPTPSDELTRWIQDMCSGVTWHLLHEG